MDKESEEFAANKSEKSQTQIEILQRLDDGEIDAATAAQLLEAMQKPGSEDFEQEEKSAAVVIDMLERGEFDIDQALGALSGATTASVPAGQDSVLNTPAARLKLLQEIEDGAVDADSAAERFEAQSGQAADSNVTIQQQPLPEKVRQDSARLKRTAMWLFGAGSVLLSAFGGWLASIGGWWWLCAGPAFMVGLPLIVITVFSTRSPWVYIHIKTKENWPKRIILTLPVPLRFAAWFLRNFGMHIGELDQTTLDELLMALEGSLIEDGPIIIEVDKGPDGERVQVYIG